MHFVKRKLWSVLCVLSCVAAPLMAAPLSVIVTVLFVEGFDISAASVESNATVFLVNQVMQSISNMCPLYVHNSFIRFENNYIPEYTTAEYVVGICSRIIYLRMSYISKFI